MPDNSDRHCRVCEHLFHRRHMDNHRAVATDSELSTGRCRDCLDCNPPGEAPIRERTGQEVPA